MERIGAVRYHPSEQRERSRKRAARALTEASSASAHGSEQRERSQTIRASEVGEYVYCARAWWLRRVAGEEPEGHERRAAGVLLHARHGRAVSLSGAALWLGVIALAAGLLLFLAS